MTKRTKKRTTRMKFLLCLCLITVHVGCKLAMSRCRADECSERCCGVNVSRHETRHVWNGANSSSRLRESRAMQTHTPALTIECTYDGRERNAFWICQNRVISFLSMHRQRQGRLLLFPILPDRMHSYASHTFAEQKSSLIGI